MGVEPTIPCAGITALETVGIANSQHLLLCGTGFISWPQASNRGQIRKSLTLLEMQAKIFFRWYLNDLNTR